MDQKSYPLYKGLQKPITFKGLSGKNILLAALTILLAFFFGVLLLAFDFTILGLSFAILTLLVGFAYILYREKRGTKKVVKTGIYIPGKMISN